MATADAPVRSDVDEELRELVDEVFRHPPSVQLIAYIRERDPPLTTAARLRPWMTVGQFEYALAKLEDADLITVAKSEQHRYGARDPPRMSTLTQRGEQLVEVAKDEGYRNNLWRRAEAVHKEQREVDQIKRQVQRLEEMLTAEDLEGTDVSHDELVDHVEGLEDYVYEWTEVAERHLDALWDAVDEDGEQVR